VERFSTRLDDASPETSSRFLPKLSALGGGDEDEGASTSRGRKANYGGVVDASALPVVRAGESAAGAKRSAKSPGGANPLDLSLGNFTARRQPGDTTAAEIRTLLEPVFKPDGGTGSQIDGPSLLLYSELPPSLDEAGKGSRVELITTPGAPTDTSDDAPLCVPAQLKAKDPKALCLRVSHAPEAKGSHTLALELPQERTAILALIEGVVNDVHFWEKRRQLGKNNPHVVLAHNVLVRVRRFHRLLEDTKPAELPAETIDAILRMHEFCAIALSESTVPAIYNQAVKHIGEFFCYKYVSPPVLELANVPKRGSAGSANDMLRTGIAALFGLLIKGYVDDPSRGAIRESLRCAAASWAPPLMLCEVALDAMTDNLKYRDVFAVRTREMGLTAIFMVVHRHSFSSVRRYFELQDRATGQPSKMHTLIACLGMAHSEGARSALNRELSNRIAGALRTHIGLDALHDVISALKLERNLATDLLTAAATAPALDPKALRPAAGRKHVGGLGSIDTETVEQFTVRSLSPPASSDSRTHTPPGIHHSSAMPTPSGLPMSEVVTLREAVFINDGMPVTQILHSTLLLLKALPASSVEIATSKNPPPEVTAPPKEKFGLQVPASRALRAAEPVGLCLRVNNDAKSFKSHVLAANIKQERGAIIELIGHATSFSQLWSARQMSGSNAPGVALVHNSLVRIRRYHRLLEDSRPTELEPTVLTSVLRMLEWCTTVLQQATLPAHFNQALKHISEFFCYKYVSRSPLEQANTGKHAMVGSAGYSIQQATSMVFYYLNREMDGTTGRMVRETIRCIVCSEAPSLILVDCALEAMITNLKGRDSRALSLREMCLTAVYMVLARRDWLEVKPFFSAADRTTGLPARTCVVVTAMAYALAEGEKSPLNNTLVTRLAVVLHRHLGNRFADVVRLAQLDKGMTESLIRLAGIDEDLIKSRRKSRRRSARGGALSSRRTGKSTRDFFGAMTRKMSRGDM
jgi:hypothetical protein